MRGGEGLRGQADAADAHESGRAGADRSHHALQQAGATCGVEEGREEVSLQRVHCVISLRLFAIVLRRRSRRSAQTIGRCEIDGDSDLHERSNGANGESQRSNSQDGADIFREIGWQI
jgi:hypothetical protein